MNDILRNLCERYETTLINFPEKKYSQFIESTLCTTERSLLHKYLSKPHACNFSVGETVPRDNTGRCWWHVSCHGKILSGKCIYSLAPGIFGHNFWKYNFNYSFPDWYLQIILWQCPQINATRLYWSYIKTDSSNGLVPSGKNIT